MAKTLSSDFIYLFIFFFFERQTLFKLIHSIMAKTLSSDLVSQCYILHIYNVAIIKQITFVVESESESDQLIRDSVDKI